MRKPLVIFFLPDLFIINKKASAFLITNCVIIGIINKTKEKNLLIFVPRILCGFFIEPPTDVKAEKGDRSTQGERQRTRKMGFFVCCYLLCTIPPPPHLSPILRDLPHPSAAMVIRTGGTARRPPPPSLPPTRPHPISAARDISGESLWWPLFFLFSTLFDGDHFLFSTLFDTTPVSRYTDCYSLAKSVNFRQTPIFCRRQNLWHFLHSRPVQCWESPHIKAGRPEATPH